MDISAFNNLPKERVVDSLLECCSAPRWAERLADQRPFDSTSALLESSDACWAEMGEQDLLDAFDGHPKIGDPDSLKKKYASTKDLATSEQSGVHLASDETIDELATYNQSYLEKFGFIFIICATGKSAEEMLASIKNRMSNSRERELSVAAEEQRKITNLRLMKLLDNK